MTSVICVELSVIGYRLSSVAIQGAFVPLDNR